MNYATDKLITPLLFLLPFIFGCVIIWEWMCSQEKLLLFYYLLLLLLINIYIMPRAVLYASFALSSLILKTSIPYRRRSPGAPRRWSWFPQCFGDPDRWSVLMWKGIGVLLQETKAFLWEKWARDTLISCVMRIFQKLSGEEIGGSDRKETIFCLWEHDSWTEVSSVWTEWNIQSVYLSHGQLYHLLWAAGRLELSQGGNDTFTLDSLH